MSIDQQLLQEKHFTVVDTRHFLLFKKTLRVQFSNVSNYFELFFEKQLKSALWNTLSWCPTKMSNTPVGFYSCLCSFWSFTSPKNVHKYVVGLDARVCWKNKCLLRMALNIFHSCILYNSLLINKRFALNLMLQRNASKFAIFYV